MISNVLRFSDLAEAQIFEYVEHCNNVAQLRRRLKRSGPIRLGMAIVTGGASLIFSGPRSIYQVAKKSSKQEAARSLIERERSRQSRTHIEWNTFPSAHLVVGGLPMQPNCPPSRCPLCKNLEFRGFVASGAHEIFTCASCSRTMIVKVNRYGLQTEELIVPGVFAGSISFIHPIEHLGDLAEHASHFADCMGDALATVLETALDMFM